ncbi:uncharacterized protein P174DRAFT_397707 [Aspergillus novofumigatus IBT 16806]|uniref:Uncharacterized protein n=1 Tax=Aspergillus novofumigatus (strain IBT 16806) TaxID=1392255 RepID=A0A2I1BTN8_ASPN1|nr:uncharacterized protein P174DRAFT_397707 [Aspergillus novofumigatus IBT 16806]PKX88758.1 hypothetical protein P174DRAFT_397707 [Aspergillus novofumigatus IBT 16806]
MATPVNITSYFNRGPLTTTFTPPTTCLQTLSTAVYEVNGIPQTTMYYGHWFDGLGQTCYPTGTMPTSLLLSPTYWGTYWYSPGLYCPSGWATAGQLSGSWNGIDIISSTSGAICCPWSMSHYAGGHQCSGVLPAKETVAMAASGIIVTSVLSTPVTVYADGIPLIWEASDLPKSTSVLQRGTSSSSFGPTSTSPLASSMAHSGQSGLAEGAKIGIGVGVPLGALTIGAVVFFDILRRHRKGKINQSQPLSQEYVRQSEPAELSSSGPRSELESPFTVRHELA